MANVYLGLGSNLGDREARLQQAVECIAERVGPVVALSAFYETEPWGFDSDHLFMNAACVAETALTPGQVLQATQQLEREMGRTRKSVGGTYADRPIDIDLLLYDDLVCHTPDLVLPHPLMHERLFVMQPLAEIAPRVVHPVLHESLEKLLSRLMKC